MGKTKFGFLLAVHNGAQNVPDARTRAAYAATEVRTRFMTAARKPRRRSVVGELAALRARLLPWDLKACNLAVPFGLGATGRPG